MKTILLILIFAAMFFFILVGALVVAVTKYISENPELQDDHD